MNFSPVRLDKVLVITLLLIMCMSGLKAVRPKTWMVISLETADAMVGGNAQYHGHPGQCNHLFNSSRSGLYRWNEVVHIFWTPIAMVVVCIFFVPIFLRLKIYTAYELSGTTIDVKTRTLISFLFLLSRDLQPG